MGVKPDELDAEIERLKGEIEAGLSEAEKLLREPVEEAAAAVF